MALALLLSAEIPKGVERWTIKTTLLSQSATPKAKHMDLADLIALDPPKDPPYTAKKYKAQKTETARMRDLDNVRPQEGDLIWTEGNLQVVMLSSNDSDYHIQLTVTPEDRQNCFIVEIPHEKWADAPALTDTATYRQWLRTATKIKSADFSTGGTCMQHPPRVKVYGQLFYDINHQGGKRGVRGCHSTTLWELHPVYKIVSAHKATLDAGPCPKP